MTYTSHQVLGFDYVEHFVGNAKHSAIFYASLYGFKIEGYLGPETGVRDRVSYLLKQNDLTFLITAPIIPTGEIQDFLAKHGDGIREISLRVEDVSAAMDHAIAHGATQIQPLRAETTPKHGHLLRGTIQLYGDTHMTLIDRSNYQGTLPGYVTYTGPQYARNDVGLLAIDHIVGNVPVGEMNTWAKFFEDALDFETYIHFDKGDISTQYSSLVSKVVRSKNNAAKFPINEPSEGIKKSQIDEYLDVNYGPGVQHIAILTNNIVQSIENMRGNGVCFIETPSAYYDVVSERAQGIDEALEMLRKNSILIDRDDEGYLLQLFTQPLGDRPTLFFEFIQRKGCQGFGQNNFQALFESIEREQAKRGNL